MNTTGGASWVGGSTFSFRVHSDGQVETIPLAGNAPHHFTPDGSFRWDDPGAVERGEYFGDLEVQVDIWRKDGRLFCGAVTVRTVPGGPTTTDMARSFSAANTLGPEVTAEITSRLWRSVPLGSLVSAALEQIRTAPERYPQASAEALEVWRQNAALSDGKAKPGPKSALTPEVLATVVAPAYAAGGSRPVQAVREELARSGYGNGHVTIDQARKAVARARSLGLIPPATKGKRRASEEGVES